MTYFRFKIIGVKEEPILHSLKLTIATELAALQDLQENLDQAFVDAVKALSVTEGRIVISGIGKSAIVAQKIVATLNSTGSPALFLHAADAIHGDLGMVQAKDSIILISNSGNTPEIKVLTPLIKERGTVMIAISGNKDSFLAQESDYFINSRVKKEACPNNLAPTSSTTVQMVIGDAIAVALLELKGFTAEDFAKYHPGGLLGKKMYLRVKDLSKNNQKPVVKLTDNLKKVIVTISSARLGAVAVLDEQGSLKGVITDGDIRRMLENGDSLNQNALSIMSHNPRIIDGDTLVIDALQLMRKNKITQLIVVEEGQYTGIIHIHDILKEGFV